MYKKYTVSQLNRETKHLLNNHFLTLEVEGEISNLSSPSSGHIYFSLKDDKAQIRCAMFRGNRRRLGFTPENGNQVIVTAQVSLYEARGDYQLIVEKIQEAGDGALQRKFDELKLKLAKEGLFDSLHKQSIPTLPSCIGLVTSPTGAAITDILSVLRRRFPAIPVIIYPSAVQGESAKFEIARALEVANQRHECDVIILARGGGSLEDLWAFNEEIVARAIYASAIPIATGIGHEIDTTIADFVADLRAPTPSVAAEHLTPDHLDWLQQFRKLENRIIQLTQSQVSQASQRLDWLNKSLQQQRPDKQLQNKTQRLDELELRSHRALQLILGQAKNRITTQTARLRQFNPLDRIDAYHKQRQYLNQRLQAAIIHLLKQRKQRLSGTTQTLEAVSPLATLSRGYAMVNRQIDNEIVTSSRQVKKGDRVQTRLAKGHFISQIEATYES